MLKHKITLLTLITGLLTAPATADLEFRDPDNVSFYTGLEFNGDNQIYGLAEPTASSSPVRLQDVESGFYNLSGDTLEGDLNVDGYDINNFFENACGEDQAVKEVYNNGTFVCGESETSSGLPEVLENNNTLNQDINASNQAITNFFNNTCGSNRAVKEIYDNGTLRCGQAAAGLPTALDIDNSANQNIDLNDYRITGLSEPVNSNDAVRLQDVGDGFLNRTGDTLTGNLSFDNSYYITDLENPENSDDAATKGYVDFNDNVIPDDQGLSVSSDPGNGGDTTIDIDNGSSATFTDDFEADTDAQSQCGTGEVLTGSGCVSRYGSGDDEDTSDTNEIQDPTVTTTGDEVTVSLDDGGSSDSATIDDDNTQLDDIGASSNVNMNNYRIKGLAKSQNSNDAVRQDQLSGFYNLSGDTLDGDLELGGNEIQDSSGQITLGNGNVNIPDGNLNLNGNNVTSTGNREICAGDMC